MKTRALGTSGVELTVIGYGAWEAGEDWGPVDEDAIVAAIHAAIEVGINWVDTAEAYGGGSSERIAGRALAGRDDVLVATKLAPRPAGSGFAKDEVRAGIEGSLQRLGRDRIDLYQLHWPSDDVPVEETWESMSQLVDEGLVRAIGVSNFDRSLIERCERIRHVDSLQPHASMLQRQNLDLARWAAEHGTSSVAYSPLACGLLTGAITDASQFHEQDWRSGSRGYGLYDKLFGQNLERHLAVVDRLRPVAARLGTTIAELAIAWVLHQPGFAAAIVGSRNERHVRANAGGAELTLSVETMAELETILGRG